MKKLFVIGIALFALSAFAADFTFNVTNNINAGFKVSTFSKTGQTFQLLTSVTVTNAQVAVITSTNTAGQGIAIQSTNGSSSSIINYYVSLANTNGGNTSNLLASGIGYYIVNLTTNPPLINTSAVPSLTTNAP